MLIACVTESKKGSPLQTHLTWKPRTDCTDHKLEIHSVGTLTIRSESKKRIKILFGEEMVSDTIIDPSASFSFNFTALKYPFPNIYLIDENDTTILSSKDSVKTCDNDCGYFATGIGYYLSEPGKSDTAVNYDFTKFGNIESKRLACDINSRYATDTIKNIRKYANVTIYGDLGFNGSKLTFFKYDSVTVYRDNGPTKEWGLVPVFAYFSTGIYGKMFLNLDSVAVIEQKFGNNGDLPIINIWLER